MGINEGAPHRHSRISEVNDLHTKYRPTELKQVMGQGAAVKALRAVIDRGTSHSFLFTGPSGVGKTTIARIVANAVGIQPPDLLELDAASNSSVNDMRDIVDKTNYLPAYGDSRGCIVDEAHALSKQAWQAVLKSCEEPPAHFFWFFCTTEVGKVPNTIQTRCTNLLLTSIDHDDVFDRIQEVAKAEGIDLDDDILDVIAKSANGSMRAALVGLAACSRAKDSKQAAKILRHALPDKDLIDFVRYIAGGKAVSWDTTMARLEKIGDVEPESLRITLVHYLMKMLAGCKDNGKAAKLLSVLSMFRTPYLGTTPRVDLLLSLGELIYEVEE